MSPAAHPGEPGTAAEALAFLGAITLDRDDDLWVLDKPWGMPVHKGTATGLTIDGMLALLRDGDGEGPRLVHRIDKETSGCLMVARSRAAAARIGRDLERGRIVKCYWAIVHGVPEPRAGRIDLPLVKVTTQAGDRVRAARPEDGGMARSASTLYEVLEARADRFAWVALQPLMGRNRQLRAHMSEIGHPILGDKEYPAPAGGAAARLHLLARSLQFGNGSRCVVAPLPAHMAETFARLGFRARERKHVREVAS